MERRQERRQWYCELVISLGMQHTINNDNYDGQWQNDMKNGKGNIDISRY